MALDQSALLEVLDALKAADVGDRVRQAAETVYQALIEAELTDAVGAGGHERSAERSNQRNGYRARTLSTTAGDLELRIPTLRTGSLFTSLLERRRRVDQALFAVVMEAYLHGVSTRKVDDRVKALGADTGISKSEVSRICADLDVEVGAFRDRSLADQSCPYVFLDAAYCRARVDHQVVSQAVVIATGVRADGWREVLGFAVGDSEDGAFWTAFLRSLKARGLGGVQLVISDAHTGLKQAISTVLLGAAWQRCTVDGGRRHLPPQVRHGAADDHVEQAVPGDRRYPCPPRAQAVRRGPDAEPDRQVGHPPSARARFRAHRRAWEVRSELRSGAPAYPHPPTGLPGPPCDDRRWLVQAERVSSSRRVRSGGHDGGRGVRWRERSRLVRAVRLWRTRDPRTFREKVRYKMLRDHRELVVTFADKSAVRDHVATVVGERFLPRAYAIVDDPEELRDLALPEAYVVKPTHGSGAAIVVSDRAPGDARLPTDPGSWVYRHVRPEFAPREDVVGIARGWVAQLYGRGPNHEWVYGWVPRRVIVEELLAGVDGAIPDDYKFFVFHGRCAFVQVDAGRFGRRTQDFFRPDWQHLQLSGGPPWAEPAKPVCLTEMIEVAERLGADTDFVRVDLYDVDGRVVFGELTSFPAGGDSPFDPESFDEEFGRPWRVPRRYR